FHQQRHGVQCLLVGEDFIFGSPADVIAAAFTWPEDFAERSFADADVLGYRHVANAELLHLVKKCPHAIDRHKIVRPKQFALALQFGFVGSITALAPPATTSGHIFHLVAVWLTGCEFSRAAKIGRTAHAAFLFAWRSSAFHRFTHGTLLQTVC